MWTLSQSFGIILPRLSMVVEPFFCTFLNTGSGVICFVLLSFLRLVCVSRELGTLSIFRLL